MRKSTLRRTTAETDIELTLCLDGTGESNTDTGCGFLNHMLTLLAKHASFDLSVTCRGDTDVDDHHTVEDVGICLGTAFAQALSDKRGIRRYGDTILPMDEALVLTAADCSGRGYLAYQVQVPAQKVGTFDTELAEEFFLAFTRASGVTLHIRQLAGTNSHHILEACFKSLAHTLREAVSLDGANRDRIPSTKGTLS